LIRLRYPENEAAAVYYDRIIEKIGGTITAGDSIDLQKVSYAKGFTSYQQHSFNDALNEWGKVLELNPRHKEVREYVQKTKTYLADLARLQREKEFEEESREMIRNGIADFDRGDFVSCVKTMEKAQKACTDKSFSSSLEYYSQAKEYIARSLRELSSSLHTDTNKRHLHVRSHTKSDNASIDEQGAEDKYKEGLIMYAQGKQFDAEKLWEIALRLDPNHEKARRALKKVRQGEK
jgi:tetratricopeptide (TPR) repeat protein